ncbi:MAG: hypothetical protein JWN51_1513 [Phycisphaerales bacterium]|nr:hypothetical protein [Phycisphaerales bacterium]
MLDPRYRRPRPMMQETSPPRTGAIGCCTGVAVTPVALWFAVASGGAGHGSYNYAWFLFPYTMWFAVMLGTIALPGILLALVQFPLYGFLLGHYAAKSRRAIIAAAGVIAAIHTLAVCLRMIL